MRRKLYTTSKDGKLNINIDCTALAIVLDIFIREFVTLNEWEYIQTIALCENSVIDFAMQVSASS